MNNLSIKLAELILVSNRQGITYREMSKMCGVKPGTINRFAKAKGKWIPKDKSILVRLGLVQTREKKISEMSSKELLWRLNNRKEY